MRTRNSLLRALALSAVLFSSACSEDVLPSLLTLRGPVDLGVVCIKNGQGAPVADCADGSGQPFALILNAERGSVARLRLPIGTSSAALAASGFVDDDRFVPGISPLYLGSRPTEPSRPVSIVVSADGSASYIANLATSNIARVDNTLLASDVASEKASAISFQPLPSRPSDLVMRYPNGPAAGETDEVLVALTDAAAVARIPVAGFGGHSELESIATPGGSPFDLAASGSNTVYVGHADVAYVSVLDLDAGIETARIPLASPCFDDVDNNGDGLIDSADYGCRIDSRGAEQATPAGAMPFETVTLPQHNTLPACANGIDDDGDGATDFPDDSDCMSPTSAWESPVPQPIRARLALSPDGSLLYATNARDRMVIAIDTAAGEPIDINAPCAPGANPLYRQLGHLGILLTGVPLDVTIAQRPDEADPNDASQTVAGPLIAMVSTANGTVSVVEIEADVDGDGTRERVHRLVDAQTEARDPIFSSPQLFDYDGGIDLGRNRRPDFPSLGEYRFRTDRSVPTPDFMLTEPAMCTYPEIDPQRVETDVDTYFGVAVAPNERLAVRETWSITHEGVFLERTARFGAFLDHAAGTFATPEPIFCSGGVKPGDTLVVRTPNGLPCGNRDERAWRFTITGVTEHRLTVDPQSGAAFEDADGLLIEAGEATAVDLSAECFPEALAYEVRVPSGVYAVEGSVSGYQHNQMAAADGTCADDPDADPRFTGRAAEWTLNAGATLPACPITDDEVDQLMSGEWFHNYALSFRVVPGCERLEDGTGAVLPSETGVRWSFLYTSSFVPLTIANLGTPRSLRWVPSREEVFAVDAGQEKVVGIPTADLTATQILEEVARRTYR